MTRSDYVETRTDCINICIPHNIHFPLSTLASVRGCLMTMSTCPLSTILGPGVQLGVPRICLRHIFAPEATVQVFTAQHCCTTASASSHLSTDAGPDNGLGE